MNGKYIRWLYQYFEGTIVIVPANSGTKTDLLCFINKLPLSECVDGFR